MAEYKAVILGASGAVGGAVLQELLASARCTLVTALVRRDLGVQHDKLKQHLVNLDNLRQEAEAAVAGHDVAFCTLGVGQPSKVSKEEHWKVDVTYAEAFAELCKAGGVNHISLLGGLLADPNAKIHALKVKGAAEEVMKKQGFERCSLYRPSILITKKNRYGLTDVFNQNIAPILLKAFPSRYHEIKVEDLGRAMVLNAEKPGQGIEVLEYDDYMWILGRKKREAAL